MCFATTFPFLPCGIKYLTALTLIIHFEPCLLWFMHYIWSHMRTYA